MIPPGKSALSQLFWKRISFVECNIYSPPVQLVDLSCLFDDIQKNALQKQDGFLVGQNKPKTKMFYFVGGFALTRWF